MTAISSTQFSGEMRAGAPTSLNHVAYLTFDAGATRDFYTKVLGCQLVAAVQEDRVPSTGAETPFLHLFFSFASGECIAFFDVDGVEPADDDDGLPRWAPHLALNVGSREELEWWKRRLNEVGVETLGVVDHHGIWYSLYFHDPNGIRLELCYQARPLDERDAKEAVEMVDRWIASRTGNTGGS